MIAKFDTTNQTPAKSGSSSTWIIALVGIGVLAYGYYKFIYLPKKEKEQEK